MNAVAFDTPPPLLGDSPTSALGRATPMMLASGANAADASGAGYAVGDGISPSLYGRGPAAPSWGAAGGTGTAASFGPAHSAYVDSADMPAQTLTGIVDALMTTIRDLIGQLIGGTDTGVAAPGAARALQPLAPAAQSVRTGSFSSWGDPHLTETATLADGTQATRKFDSMSSHADLLDSRDIAGGYRVSTQVTAPDAKGITKNASATVALGHGGDAVTMNANGSYLVSDCGRDVTLTAGDAYGLSDGTAVTLLADGSLAVGAHNDDGGSVLTTLTAKAGGVDVTATVHDLTVGGDIVAGNAAGTPPARDHLDGAVSAFG